MLKAVESRDRDTSSGVSRDRKKPSESHGFAATGLVRAIFQAILMFGVLAVSAWVMNMLLAAKPERTARPQTENAIPVDAVAAFPAAERPTIRLFGEILAARSVDIRPAVGGEVISVNPSLRAGSRVTEGETLFTVDRFSYEGQLTEAQANLAQTEAAISQFRARLNAETEQLAFAENQLELARGDLERAARLSETGALTAKQVEDRELIVSQREQAVSTRRNNLLIEQAGLEQQLATRDRLAWNVRQAQRNLEKTTVVAPFSGVIRSSAVEVGRIVSPNDVAVSLYDDEALEARFTLTDAQYGRVATDTDPLIGRGVELIWTVGGVDYSYHAEVVRIGAEVASARGGVDVYARLTGGDTGVQIRPGAFVEVSLPDRLYEDGYRLPETAIYDGDSVYLVVERELQRREVKVAAFDGADVIVQSGLEPGDQVLTSRLSRIENGLKVTLPDDLQPRASGADE
ncbi:efflux RND transporter periplasmic adaptor subunit [Oricola cellulosilytica]|uniref:Efflux RND transporter periplasmic adaptor subunit n=1 Tax=Oricola cellulosilytica TaxID=1429082 RepID=A0A4R0PIH6_9HYPH|nr:efflux RND transporter periplasmic adaptor subunit [Oricola cellulosilytica]TCD16504.1 efflux RND transporter periplasmic adaptor subunit [Oricola cellulosilytica]